MVFVIIVILVITGTKLDDTFPVAFLEGYSNSYWLDHSENGEGIMIFVSDDIPLQSMIPSPLTNGKSSSTSFRKNRIYSRYIKVIH